MGWWNAGAWAAFFPVPEAVFFVFCHLVPSLGFVPCNDTENVCKKKLKKQLKKKMILLSLVTSKGKLYRECL